MCCLMFNQCISIWFWSLQTSLLLKTARALLALWCMQVMCLAIRPRKKCSFRLVQACSRSDILRLLADWRLPGMKNARQTDYQLNKKPLDMISEGQNVVQSLLLGNLHIRILKGKISTNPVDRNLDLIWNINCWHLQTVHYHAASRSRQDTTWERPTLLPDGTVQFFPTEDETQSPKWSPKWSPKL